MALFLRSLTFLLPFLWIGAVAAEPLRSIAEMRGLSPAQLAERPAIEVEVVALTVVSVDGGELVVWQKGVGMYLSTRRAGGDRSEILPQKRIEPGDRLRVKGSVWESYIAPIIVPSHIEWLGAGTLPDAQAANLIEMRGNRLASQWVRVDGVVQAVKPSPGGDGFWLLQIGTPHGRFPLRLAQEPDVAPTEWIDAEVSIRGVCLHIFNHRGESIGVRIQANGVSEITRLSTPPDNPFAVEESQLGRLLPFTPHETMPHRRKISGVVTLCRPGQYLYLQQGNRGVKVNTSDPTAFQPGDMVEAAGFISMGQYHAEVQHALLRRVGGKMPPEPLQITTHWPNLLRLPHENAPIKDVNGRLLELDGVLELKGVDGDGRWLSVLSEGFAAEVRLPEGMDAIPRRGSVVRLTGICELRYPDTDLVEDFQRPNSMRLLLRDPADLTVIQAASWWTPQRLWMVVAAVGALLALTLIWVTTLTRKVQQRGMQLAGEISGRQMAEARAEERTRMAEELHDTLAQGLTGVSMQLAAAGRAREQRPDELPHHLQLAGQILHAARDEVRRALWNLRSGLLDTGDLIGSLQAIAANLSPDTKPEISCRSVGEARPLPESVAHALLRIAQEALSNAVKHSDAGEIDVVVEFGESEVSLIVGDNGRGFHADDAAKMAASHFGLQGMRDRTRRLHGQFQIDSKPGSGTTIKVTVPDPS
jgi:signal transduction histidine kinase